MEGWAPRKGRGPGTPSFVGSFLVHSVVVVLAVLATRTSPEPLTYITYEVEIVSPPPAVMEETTQDPEPEPTREDELVVERPEPEPAEVEDAVPEPEATPDDPDPEPEPETTDPEPEDDPEPEVDPEETAPTVDPEAELAEESGEDLEVRMEGLRRDFPEYYGNIIRQIRRCFRPPPGLPGGLETTVYFVIRADGTVTDLRFMEQSGNPDLDYEALGAIGDCAGRGRFGSLPDELPYERLPIQFTFRPSGEDPNPVESDPVRTRER